MVNSPWFGQLRGFSVEDYFDQQHLEVLLSAPASKGLRDLDLSTWTSVLIGKAWTPLAEAKSLAKLESLTLDGCELQAEGLRSLAQAPLRNLRRLSIIAGEGWEMGPEGFRILTSRKNLPKLQTLFLRNQSGGGEGLKILTAWPGLKRLARLEFSCNFTDNDDYHEYAKALHAFVHSRHWGKLRELNLDGNSVPDLESLEALLSSPKLSSLQVLTIDVSFHDRDDNSLQNEAAAMLASCPHFAKDLEFRFCKGARCGRAPSPSNQLSQASKKMLIDRFGDGLVLYPDDGMSHFYE